MKLAAVEGLIGTLEDFMSDHADMKSTREGGKIDQILYCVSSLHQQLNDILERGDWQP